MAFPSYTMPSGVFFNRIVIQERSVIDDTFGPEVTWVTRETRWAAKIPLPTKIRLEYGRRGIKATYRIIFRESLVDDLNLDDVRFVDQNEVIFVPAEPAWEPHSDFGGFTSIVVRRETEEFSGSVETS